MEKIIDVIHVFTDGRIVVWDSERRIIRDYHNVNAFLEPKKFAGIVRKMPLGAYLKRMPD